MPKPLNRKRRLLALERATVPAVRNPVAAAMAQRRQRLVHPDKRAVASRTACRKKFDF